MAGRNFIAYKSSAGSGKTYTLVREYLKIVLQNPDLFRNILAITFTNKAANEMKERVVHYLIVLADPDRRKKDKAIISLLPQLTTYLKMSDEQVFDRAEKVLRLIMHHYGEFSISTIDSFTHRVVRTFAHDLNIPMNFEVELEADTMLEEAVDELISFVGTDTKLTRVLIEYIEKKAGDEMNWQIEKDLNAFGRTLLDEESIRYLGELRKHDLETFMEIRGRLIHWISLWEDKVREMAVRMAELCDSAGIIAEDVFQKGRGVLKYLEGIKAGNPAITLPNSYARKSLAEGVWLGNQANQVARDGFNRVKVELLPLGASMVEILDKEFSRYSVVKLLLNNLYATALLGEIEKLLYAACLEDNKVLISEFNRRISAIVKEQPAPFIYERLGERYQHYLLDEFQDTSVMQWHNLLPLVENALASGRMNLVVGDAKQAIYRWRSGDARQFEILPELLREGPDPLLDDREKVLEDNFREEKLEMNHRSSPVIVDFNNRFFQGIVPLLPEGYGNLYSEAAQKAARTDKPGLVRIDIARKNEETGITYREAVHEKILSTIEEIKDDGYSLQDIVILCRQNDKAADIAVTLINRGISVISTEFLLLTQSENVNFFLAFARHLAAKSDPVSMANIAHYLYRHGYLGKNGFDELCLDLLFARPSVPGQEVPPAQQNFAEFLDRTVPGLAYNNLRNLDLQGLFRHLASVFRLDLGSDSYLRFFMDNVMEFMRKGHGGMPEFLEWWDERSDKASVVIPEGIDAVRIMTIHKSKGLQFPVVIYPFADERFRLTKKNRWVSVSEELLRPLSTAYLPMHSSLEGTDYEPIFKEEGSRSGMDAVNVLYVALTRPEERLYVITKDLPEKTAPPVTTPKLLSYFFQSLGMFDKGKDVYQFGERFVKSRDDRQAETSEVAAAESYPGRSTLRLLLRKHAPAGWDMDEPDRNREWGILVHALLSQIKYAGDIEELVEAMVTSGEATRADAASLQRLASDLMLNPDFAPLFDPSFEVRNEIEIIDPEGISFRPDRVMIKGRTAVVADYKTGAAKESHREQILKYALLLRDMGFDVEKAFLVYLNRKPEMIRII